MSIPRAIQKEFLEFLHDHFNPGRNKSGGSCTNCDGICLQKVFDTDPHDRQLCGYCQENQPAEFPRLRIIDVINGAITSCTDCEVHKPERWKRYGYNKQTRRILFP